VGKYGRDTAPTTAAVWKILPFDDGRVPMRAFKTSVACVLSALFAFFGNSLISAEEKTAAAISPDDQTNQVVAAAKTLVDVLNEGEKSKCLFKFNDEAQRLRWSNLPTGIFERKGLRMGDLKPEQRDSVMAVLKATLSASGYQQILDNVAAEETLNQGGRRGRLAFGKDEFYFSILGTPSTAEPWMWQFGGHHLAINATIVRDQITVGPSLTGGQPMHCTSEGRKISQMEAEIGAAFELVNALNEAQKKKAVLGDRFSDMLLGPGKDDVIPASEGISAKELTEAQTGTLKRLIKERIGLLNAEDFDCKMKSIESEMEHVHFSWRGPNSPGSAAYYRVQGLTFFLEFAPQQMGGAPMEHIHAMYREFKNDYGEQWVKGQ
jgi:hypothetical protein